MCVYVEWGVGEERTGTLGSSVKYAAPYETHCKLDSCPDLTKVGFFFSVADYNSVLSYILLTAVKITRQECQQVWDMMQICCPVLVPLKESVPAVSN